MTISQILLCWVELELINLPKYFLPDTSTDINKSQFFDIRVTNDTKYAEYLLSIGRLYKSVSPVFRRVANSIVTFYMRSVTLRPLEKDKIQVCRSLASFIDNFNRFYPSNFGNFKSPLKVLVEAAYELNYQFAEDEMALLFALLVESMGIKTKFILSNINGHRKLDVACQTENQFSNQKKSDDIYNYTIYSFSNKQFREGKLHINNFIEFSLSDMDEINVPVKDVTFNTVKNYVSTGNRNLTYCWNNSMVSPEARRSNWFKLLLSARKQFIKNDFPFIVSQYENKSAFENQHGQVVGINYGAEATASIIAWVAYIMGNYYKDVFITFLKQEILMPQNLLRLYNSAIMGNIDAQKQILISIFYYIRKVFPYSEETIGVEQLASPLNMLFVHSFYPYIQRYDCDDLSLIFMAFAESLGIVSKVRLAGNPYQYNYKFHVYPVINFNNGEELVHDVSSPTEKIYWEMDKGDNFIDYTPSEPNTYLKTMEDVKNNHNLAAGYEHMNGINLEL